MTALMAKPPNRPKGDTPAAQAPFDMNSRDRKGGGKGGPRGPGRGRERDDKRPPSRIVSLPPTVVDRGEGWVIQKIGRVDQNSHVSAGAQYNLIFEGHDPLVFDYLSAARDRSKEPPPEKAPEPEPVEAAAEETAEESTGTEAAEPEAAEPDTAEPDTAEPDTTEPDAAEANLAEPDSTTPAPRADHP